MFNGENLLLTNFFIPSKQKHGLNFEPQCFFCIQTINSYHNIHKTLHLMFLTKFGTLGKVKVTKSFIIILDLTIFSKTSFQIGFNELLRVSVVYWVWEIKWKWRKRKRKRKNFLECVNIFFLLLLYKLNIFLWNFFIFTYFFLRIIFKPRK